MIDSMQCEEREKIIALLLEAVTAYANAVQAMKDLHGKALKRSFALLDQPGSLRLPSGIDCS
jgi:hypothetical protein